MGELTADRTLLVSQGRAAEIAGVSRAEFVEALGRYGVTPFQDSLDELMQAARAQASSDAR